MTTDDMQAAVDRATALGAGFCDIRLDSWQGLSLEVMQSRTRNVVSSLGSGAGVRALVGGAWGFATTIDTSRPSLIRCSETAVRLARACTRFVKEDQRFTIPEGAKFASGRDEVTRDGEMDSIAGEDKIKFCLDLDKSARARSMLVKNVVIRFSESFSESAVVNSLGAHIEKSIGTVYALTNVMVKENDVLQSGSEVFSHIGCWNTADPLAVEQTAIAAVDQGLRLLKAKPCPPGAFTIVVDNKLGGVFVHEAMGHACEADSILAGQSILESKVGNRVGNEAVTIVDDGSRRDLFGYMPSDSEGIPSRKTILVKDGVLAGYLHDLETASRMEQQPTGNGRAEGFDCMPQVRMTNTYLEPRDWKPDEIVADTGRGIYCRNWQYGYVEPEKGNFMFKCKEAMMIENGQQTTSLKDVALSGQILSVLHDIDAIGNDFGSSGGMCGKGGQRVRVSDASPHFRIKNVLVGGMDG
ncbi:MAG: TldD/PmbA family protein [Candidatus Lokiarchaeota archaeon]|nr:TldD/PmbA family protein [Candidatus Lokiarchaeota archaeon]